jgi:hypothetical protein
MISGGLATSINSKYLSPLNIFKNYRNTNFLLRLAWDSLYNIDERKNNALLFDRDLALKSLKIVLFASFMWWEFI